MAVLSRTTHDLHASALPAHGSFRNWVQRFNDGFDRVLSRVFDALVGWLCRASRGYLCPPDMPSIMYPEDRRSDNREVLNSKGAGVKGCCNEDLPGK
jgi:hypothetical protein